MSPRQHVTQATRHLLAAAKGEEEVDPEPSGVTCNKFDDHGKALWHRLFAMHLRIKNELASLSRERRGDNLTSWIPFL